MTELYIDGVAVVLPFDFSTEIKVENSFLTKNGEYTYDIRLPLNNPINAKLYEHLHRVNNVTDIKNKRQAVLIADNRVLVNGTEVITDWANDYVSIQLVSGNSELNYLIQGDKKISELDLGTVLYHGLSDNSVFKNSINLQYPNCDYVSAPVYVRSTGEILNNWRLRSLVDGTSIPELQESSRWIAQPYLCTIVRKILGVLGYSVTSNQLEESIYSQLVIVHDVNTDEYAKMMPGWTVKEFFENLERLLNLCLVVNNKKKTVSLVFANRFYINAPEVHLSAVEDEYEVDTFADPEATMATGNVKYDFPDSEYYRYACLSEAVMKRCDTAEFAGMYAAGVFLNENKPPRTIAIDTSSNRQYVYKELISDNTWGGTFNMQQVNQFASLDRGSANEIVLKMIPCGISYVNTTFYTSEGNEGNRSEWMATLESPSSVSEDSTLDSVIDMLESGVNETSESASPIALAFWLGRIQIVGGAGLEYPTMLPDSFVDWPLGGGYAVGYDTKSLRLPILERELYIGTFSIDTGKQYTFYTSDPNLPSANAVFVIRNKRFVCREMVFQINKGAKQKRWKLVCHPIDMTDAEAYKRWILTDGKWRDGGVWLDDGRWLDE